MELDSVKFISHTFCSHEYCAYPDKAIIIINKERMERIVNLSKIAGELKVYEITEFDYTPEWIEVGEADPDWSIDCSILKVSDDSFLYVGYLKHVPCDAKVTTRSITIERLKRKWRNLSTPTARPSR